MLRRMDRAPVELELASHASAAADRVLAENNAVLGWFDGEHVQVNLKNGSYADAGNQGGGLNGPRVGAILLLT